MTSIAKPKPTAVVTLTRASTIKSEQTRWLWNRRLPIGSLTILGGDPGLGKSQVAINLAASISRGTLKGDCYGTPRDVLVVSAEDSPSHTQNPRLLAAKAHMERIHYLTVKRFGVMGNLDLLNDMPQLEKSIRDTNAALVVIDPVVAHLSGEINGNQDHHVRRAIAPLAQLADNLQVAILGLMHLNKDDERKALYRIGGSIAFVGAARSVLMAAPDWRPGQEGKVLIGHVKSNLGPPTAVLQYQIVEKDVNPEGLKIRTSCVKWLGIVSGMKGTDIFAMSSSQEAQPKEVASKLEHAKNFLNFFLKTRRQPAKHLKLLAKRFGISTATLERAKTALKVKSDKDNFPGGWWWLPVDASEKANKSKIQTAPKGENGQSQRKGVPEDAMVIRDKR